MAAGWFEVDKEGLSKLVGRRGKSFVLHELLQNAWDAEGVTTVDVTIAPAEGRRGVATLMVKDDHPDGFRDLSHVYTLFAESEKKGDPKLRGRFNLGEKLVLSLCDEATIVSTTGSVTFRGPRRIRSKFKTSSGSVFTGYIRMTRQEILACVMSAGLLIPPSGSRTKVNGVVLPIREPVARLPEISLLTEISDSAGHLKRMRVCTMVELHEVRPGEQATIYEMGIPVVELGDDPYHVNVLQKVPLSMERDSVSPSYLSDIRSAVLDTMNIRLSEAAAKGKWVMDAIEESGSEEAVRVIMKKRFGDKLVVQDPSDREAEDIAKSRGYVVVPGGSLTAAAWEKVRQARAALPAGQVTPSPKPFHPDGEPLKLLEARNEEVLRFIAWARGVAIRLIGRDIDVEVADDPGWGFHGTFGGSLLRVNYGSPSMRKAIDGADLIKLGRFLIHELAHHYERNHLAEGFHEACCVLGAKLTSLALEDPDFFDALLGQKVEAA